MPKAVLEFNLPEEQSEFDLANMASKLYCCLWDIDQKIRGYLKYGHNFKTIEDCLDSLREEIWDRVELDEI